MYWILWDRNKNTIQYKTRRVALWVFPSKRGELREVNSENLKHGNHNSDTRGGERKIGAPFLQCNHVQIMEMSTTELPTLARPLNASNPWFLL